MNANIFDRYLAILGVEAEPPSLDALGRLVRAQLTRVPFENVSKLLQKQRGGVRGAPSLEEYLDGIERHRFGGTCYVNNPYFNQLLKHLGYEVDLCGADMNDPDVHIVSIVRLDGREFLVDVGYGAPFFEPIERELAHPQEIPWGQSRFVLQPRNERGWSRLDHFRSERLIHGYTVNPTPREIGHFEEIIRGSYDDSQTFMNALVIERFFEGRSVRIHNLKRIESNRDGSKPEQTLEREELAHVIHRDTGMPVELVDEALKGVDLEGDIYT